MNNCNTYRASAITYLLLLFSAGAAWSAPASTEQKLKQINSLCFNGRNSSADGRSCLQAQLDRLNLDLASAVRRRHLEISEVARKPASAVELSGEEASRKWDAAFKVEQDVWERYRQQRCQNVQDFESYPGNGAWSTQCSLRLTLERLREIEEGY